MILKILLILNIPLFLFADIVSFSITPKEYHSRKVKILDAKKLNFSDVHELSGLTYIKGHLYAVSDQGILYLFDIKLEKDKIAALSLQKQYRLTNKNSEPFKKKKRDAESICIYKKGFLISFEGKNRVLYCSVKGQKLKKMKLNVLLNDKRRYQDANKGLESVVYSKKYGILTAPELPLKGNNQNYHTIYARKKIWKFKAKGAVTDITFMDTDRVIVLLREYSYFTRHRVTSLVRVNLNKCDNRSVCQSEILALLDSANGYKIDNFEGLTKVGKNKFLMVSDDNENFFQKTLLVLFEVKN